MILGALTERFGFQPSELWEMEAYDLEFWIARAGELNAAAEERARSARRGR